MRGRVLYILDTLMLAGLNEDFLPALKPIKSAIGSDNMWSGGLSMKTGGTTIPTQTGFIMPYEDGIDLSSQELFDSIQISR